MELLELELPLEVPDFEFELDLELEPPIPRLFPALLELEPELEPRPIDRPLEPRELDEDRFEALRSRWMLDPERELEPRELLLGDLDEPRLMLDRELPLLSPRLPDR